MCSYCGCRSITIIGQFSAEHEDVINHLTSMRLACWEGDAQAAAEAARALGGALHPHTQREEISLFAEMRKDEEFTDHIDQLCQEHTDLDAMLDKIEGGDLSAYPEFERSLRNHIDREENGLFPAAAIAMSGEQWQTINAAGGLPPDVDE